MIKMFFLCLAWVLMWIPQMALKLVFMAIGLVVMPAMFKLRKVPLKDLKWYQRMFANPEDWKGGVLDYEDSIPDWWATKNGRDMKSFYRYHAIRNPADGLRNYKWLQLHIDQNKVEYRTPKYYRYYEPWHIGPKPGVYWYIAWQGIYAGLKVLWIEEDKYSEFKFGFRVEPRDSREPLKDPSARKELGASFASKLRWRRPLT